MSAVKIRKKLKKSAFSDSEEGSKFAVNSKSLLFFGIKPYSIEYRMF